MLHPAAPRATRASTHAESMGRSMSVVWLSGAGRVEERGARPAGSRDSRSQSARGRARRDGRGRAENHAAWGGAPLTPRDDRRRRYARTTLACPREPSTLTTPFDLSVLMA